MKKQLCALLPLCMAAALLAGCSDVVIQSANSEVDGLSATTIELNGGSAAVSGGGAAVSGSTVTISAAGNYSFTGSLTDGQIIVDTGDDAGLVTLILDGVDISNSADAAIYVQQAKDVTLRLAEGTVNTVSSGSEADMQLCDESASGAAIYAKDDIDIEGAGTLNVYGYINNGIACKNDIDINSGNINIVAANNGVRGSDSVEISGGVISISAGNDGVKATETDKESKGYISVTGGVVDINASGDGMSAGRTLTISGGVINISSGVSGSSDSGKGIKAQIDISVSGGSVTVDSVDHAVHSAAGVSISGGELTLCSSGGKGIAAHDDIRLLGGTVSISSAKDGIDAEGGVLISGGTTAVTAGENGVKAGGGIVSQGGELLAAGHSKVLKTFDPASTYGFLSCSISGAKGDAVQVSAGGETLCAIETQWAYNTVIYCSSAVVTGGTYTVTGGASSVETEAGLS